MKSNLKQNKSPKLVSFFFYYSIKQKSEYKLLTWLKERASELNLVRSPLSHLMEEDTLETTTPPGTPKSLVRVRLSSIRPEPDGPGLQADSRISDARSYPNPITETAFSAAICGSIRTLLVGLYAMDTRNSDFS